MESTFPGSPDELQHHVINCPVCGRKQIDTSACPRCGARLSVFISLKHTAARFAEAAMQVLGTGDDAGTALHLALRSWNLVKNRAAARAACMARCAVRDFDGMVLWYQRYRRCLIR